MIQQEEFNEKKEAIVLDLFLNMKDNTVKNISKKSGLLETTVHKIINAYLDAKLVNNG
jgi:DNA-binding MarR family transcriptional regulator